MVFLKPSPATDTPVQLGFTLGRLLLSFTPWKLPWPSELPPWVYTQVTGSRIEPQHYKFKHFSRGSREGMD